MTPDPTGRTPDPGGLPRGLEAFARAVGARLGDGSVAVFVITGALGAASAVAIRDRWPAAAWWLLRLTPVVATLAAFVWAERRQRALVAAALAAVALAVTCR